MGSSSKPEAQRSIDKVPEDAQELYRKAWNVGIGQKPVKYDKTSALLLSWDPDDDELGVATEVKKLARVFKEDYNFDVAVKELHTKVSAHQLAFKHLSDFVYEHDRARGLLIIYYAGHGWSEAAGGGKISLSGKYPSNQRQSWEDSIDWAEVERTLARTKSDVLVIFDCCHAGLLCKPAWRGPHHARCFQYLAACAATERTKAPGDESFTNAMIWALKELVQLSPSGFSAHDLLASIQRAPKFPQEQFPVVYGSRFESSLDNISIRPMPKAGEVEDEPEGEYRDEAIARCADSHFVDLRLYYEDPVHTQDVENMARTMRRTFMDGREGPSCHTISLLLNATMDQLPALKSAEMEAWKVWQVWGKHVRAKRSQSIMTDRLDDDVKLSPKTVRKHAASEPGELLQRSPILLSPGETPQITLQGICDEPSQADLFPSLVVPGAALSPQTPTSGVVASTADTEATPLIRKQLKADVQSSVDDEASVVYHLKAACGSFSRKALVNMGWFLSITMPCWPNPRKNTLK